MWSDEVMKTNQAIIGEQWMRNDIVLPLRYKIIKSRMENNSLG